MAKTSPVDHNAEAATHTETADKAADARKVCGIVMPIAPMGEDYPELHWTRVRKILQRAIDRAGLKPQMVWENAEVDVIQTAILQNIYENDVVLCDVSNLNPNVMLETGLRLSTKRPTVIITDKIIKPPFDISTIGYIDYQKDLEYNSTETFIEKLAKKIKDVADADEEGRYKSYIEQFRFETVAPEKVTVSNDQYVRDKLDELGVSVARLNRMYQDNIKSFGQNAPVQRSSQNRLLGARTATLDANHAEIAELQIDQISNVFATTVRTGEKQYEIKVYARANTKTTWEDIKDQVVSIISDVEIDFALK